MKAIRKLKIFSLKKQGRSRVSGLISIGHRGGGCKKKYRYLDFNRLLINLPALIKFFEYDPNRSAFIAFLVYCNGLCSYILAPTKVDINTILLSGNLDYPNMIGNMLSLENIKPGSLLHCVEKEPYNGGALIRAAGTFCTLIQSDFFGQSVLRFYNGKMFVLSKICRGTLGIVSNPSLKNKKYIKAGQNRLKGYRPMVRGVAKNAVDHPHGGNTSIGAIPVNETSVLSKGLKTSRSVKRQTKTKRFIFKQIKITI
jgi:large subunit ribosomal protein L2